MDPWRQGRPMVAVEAFSRLVAGIYTAASAPEHWEQSLRDLHHTLGGSSGALCVPTGAVWSIENSNLPPDTTRAYAEHYNRLDHVLDAVRAGPVGVIRVGAEIMDTGTEFYADWLRPNQLENGLLVRLTACDDPTCLVVVAAHRSVDELADPERLALFRALIPHLRQAVLIQDRLGALAGKQFELAGALDSVRHGIVVLAADHLVVTLNSAAERILRDGDGMSFRAGRIAVDDARGATELQAALADAITGDGDGVRGARSFTCVRPSGRRAFVVHVLPAPGGAAPWRRSGALVLIVDPINEPEPAPALLRRLYQLTQTEAEVAAHLMHGADLKQTSELLSVSLTTVRTHLQHVFDKTDTHRQAELVRLLHIVDP